MMLTRIQPAAVLIFTLCSLAQVQNDQTAQVSVVIANADSSNAVIAVPPETSWTATLSLSANNPKYRRSNDDLAMWVRTQSGINGLQGPNLQPWRVVIAYDEFDKDGDNVNSGIFEELWAGPAKTQLPPITRWNTYFPSTHSSWEKPHSKNFSATS